MSGAPRTTTGRRLVGAATTALLAGAVLVPAAHAAPTTAATTAYSARSLTTGSGQVFVPSTVGNPVSERGLVAGSTTVSGVRRAAVFDLAARTVRLLPDNAGQPSRAHDVNLAGEVVGQVRVDGAERAFVWTTSTGAVRTLSATGARSSTANAVNDRGVAVGAVVTATASRGTVWNVRSGNQFSLAMDVAVGINENGAVVGTRYGNGAGNTGLVWTPATLRADPLRPLAGDDSAEPADINESGVVVGRSYSLQRDDLVTRPVLWSSRTAAPCSLSTVVGNGSATAVDDRGRVVGDEVSYVHRTSRPVVWSGCAGAVSTLPSTPGSYPFPSGVDSRGRVVGAAGTGGVVWTPLA